MRMHSKLYSTINVSSLSLFLFFFISIPLSLYLYLSLHPSFSLYPSISLSFSLSHSIPLSPSLRLSPSVPTILKHCSQTQHLLLPFSCTDSPREKLQLPQPRVHEHAGYACLSAGAGCATYQHTALLFRAVRSLAPLPSHHLSRQASFAYKTTHRTWVPGHTSNLVPYEHPVGLCAIFLAAAFSFQETAKKAGRWPLNPGTPPSDWIGICT